MDKVGSTTDGLGSVDPDGAPGAESLVGSSPGTAAAAAVVEVVSDPNREGTRDRLKQSQQEVKHASPETSRRQSKPSGASVFFYLFLFSAENLSKRHAWNKRTCTAAKSANCGDSVLHTSNIKKKIRFPPFRYLGCVPQCVVCSHTPIHHTLRSLLPFFHFFSVNLPPNRI